MTRRPVSRRRLLILAVVVVLGARGVRRAAASRPSARVTPDIARVSTKPRFPDPQPGRATQRCVDDPRVTKAFAAIIAGSASPWTQLPGRSPNIKIVVI